MPLPLAFIIEDDEDLGVIFADTLTAAGYDIEVIGDGKSALERLAVAVPDLVLLDMNLPFVSGRDVLKQIRADARLTDTHVIVATANPRMAEAVQDQADLVLIKPVGFRQLLSLVSRLRATDA